MLLTISLPSSTPSSASSAEGLAPGRRLVEVGDINSRGGGRTYVDVSAFLDGDHLAVDFVDHIVNFFPSQVRGWHIDDLLHSEGISQQLKKGQHEFKPEGLQ